MARGPSAAVRPGPARRGGTRSKQHLPRPACRTSVRHDRARRVRRAPCSVAVVRAVRGSGVPRGRRRGSRHRPASRAEHAGKNRRVRRSRSTVARRTRGYPRGGPRLRPSLRGELDGQGSGSTARTPAPTPRFSARRSSASSARTISTPSAWRSWPVEASATTMARTGPAWPWSTRLSSSSTEAPSSAGVCGARPRK